MQQPAALATTPVRKNVLLLLFPLFFRSDDHIPEERFSPPPTPPIRARTALLAGTQGPAADSSAPVVVVVVVSLSSLSLARLPRARFLFSPTGRVEKSVDFFLSYAVTPRHRYYDNTPPSADLPSVEPRKKTGQYRKIILHPFVCF